MKLLSNKKGFNADNFIQVVLGIFIFTALIGTIASSVISVTASRVNVTNNVSGGATILLGLTTLILVIGFIMSIYKAKKT